MPGFALVVASSRPVAVQHSKDTTGNGTDVVPAPRRHPHRTSQLQTVIGSGKFSTVWKALHLPSGKTVAVKKVQIFEIIDTKQRTDCINEAGTRPAAASTRSPGLIRRPDS